MARVLTDADIDNLVQRYRAGETQSQLAAAFGVHQGTISSWLKKRGANITKAEAATRRYSRIGPEERAAVAAAAHEAVRGMTRRESDLVQRAATKQVRESHATEEERVLARMLRERGVDPVVLQEAVGKYNLDVGAFPVAVELFGGGWHADGRHLARLPQRVKDLADRGWNVLMVWSHVGVRMDPAVVTQEAIAYREAARRDPSFRRQYRVIRGNGQFVAAGCVDDDELALVPTGIRGANTRGR